MMQIKTNSLLIISVFFLFVLFTNSAHCRELRDIDQIFTDLKSITITKNYVLVKGRWKKYAENKKADMNKPPRVNTVSITCNKNTMICFEAIAGIVTPKDHKMGGSSTFLKIEEINYRILKWSNDIIVAKNAESRVSDFILRISLQDKTAERYRGETKARGCESCDPEIFERWIIE